MRRKGKGRPDGLSLLAGKLVQRIGPVPGKRFKLKRLHKEG